ncbi:MAG: hypothetical protein ACRDOH_06710 [Streptosporangiaceae bacterium]
MRTPSGRFRGQADHLAAGPELGKTDRRHPPEDRATDFDHTDQGWVADPYPIWDDLRQRCPVAHSDRYGGTWLPVTHDLVSEVAYDTDHPPGA